MSDITRYDCETAFDDSSDYQYAVMEPYPSGDFVRYDDHMEALAKAREQEKPADYLKQKLDTAYGELKILTDNIQLLKPHHVSKLIELNSMIGNILHWQLMDREEQEAKG